MDALTSDRHACGIGASTIGAAEMFDDPFFGPDDLSEIRYQCGLCGRNYTAAESRDCPDCDPAALADYRAGLRAQSAGVWVDGSGYVAR
jgi:hypothetical protein